MTAAPDLTAWLTHVVAGAVHDAVQTELETLARPNEVLTADEAAQYLQVSTHTIYRSVASGELPGHKVGAHLRLSRAAIDARLAGDPQKLRASA